MLADKTVYLGESKWDRLTAIVASPFYTIEIEPEPMQTNSWSKSDFVIRNVGFGAARGVLVKVIDDRFEGQAVHSQTIVTITPGLF